MSKDTEIPPLPRAYLERARLIGIVSAVIGCMYGYSALNIWKNRNFPIVAGDIVSITNRTRFFVQRVSDIVIETRPGRQRLKVVKSRDTAERLPKTVTFRFGGDPKQTIFFAKDEDHPIWIASLFWGLGGFLIASYYWLVGPRETDHRMPLTANHEN